MLTGKTIGQLTLLPEITPDTLYPVEFSGSTYHIPFSAMSTDLSVSVTYSELVEKITGSTLNTGSLYTISDFQTCYDQPDYDYYGNPIFSGNSRQADVDPIIVLATSPNTISYEAYQPSYPRDLIKYDWTWNTTEITNSPAKGRITERIDEYNNRTDYDHRAIKFKRYTTYFLGGTYSGRITGTTNPYVYGSNTSFLSDLTVGDVIFIETPEPKYYKVVEIVSDTELIVNGYVFYDFSYNVGYEFRSTNRRTYEGANGTLYYFNDVGNDDISDGGDDMYDGANEINTNLSNLIPYTHTQMTDPPVNDNNQALFEDFIMDGTVELGDSYFGAGSSYFTNCYPGLFVMVASGVTVDYFEIVGNLGSDGDGNADLFDYTLSFGGKDYSVYCKRVWDAGDPSVNHVYIVDTIDANIVHTADLSTDDDDDKIDVLSGVTQIHYLLFGLKGGVKVTDTQIQNVVLDYLALVDETDINTTLSNLNVSYSAVTSNLPAHDAGGYISMEVRQNNFTGDTDYFEHFTFSNINSYKNNYIGNFANEYSTGDSDFMLSNNVFTNSDDNTVDVYSNNFNDLFYNNTFGDDVRGNLISGPFFNRNTFYDRFGYNTIKRGFQLNFWYDGEFNRNDIDVDYSNNRCVDGDFSDNVVGNYFQNNMIRGYMENNIIDESFQSNEIDDQFIRNKIGTSCSNNYFRGGFIQNTVGHNFYSSTLWSQVESNIFGGDCYSNIIGVEGQVNNYYFKSNKFGNNCNNNTFSGWTEHNTFGDYCYQNQIADTFNYNQIANYFNGNIIGEGFGFGFSSSQGNVIGNYFYSNVIGEYFYNNRVCDGFYNNTVGDYFQNNYIKIPSLNTVDFKEYYGNISTFTYTANGSSASDNTYTGLLGTTNGNGLNASFDIVVSSNVVTNVTLNASGVTYNVSDTITILGTQIGGVDGVDDVVITVTDLSQTPSVYEVYTCDIFLNSSNTRRLSYYDGSDVLTIKDITK